MKSGRNGLIANETGDVYVFYVESWEEFKVHLKSVAELKHRIVSLDIDWFDPFHIWLCGNSHGLLNVY